MIPANVKLSKSELTFVCDEHLILTKNRIIEKVYTLFGSLCSDFKEAITAHPHTLPPEIYLNSPKIYKGEQYLGLPYVMMDYPRYFTKTDAFAIRCFFWWGNFFSITLHLSGKFAAQYDQLMLDALQSGRFNGWYYCCNEDQWEHHFETDNYTPVNPRKEAEKFPDTLNNSGFIKLSKKMPLMAWDSAYEFYTHTYSEILSMLGEK